MIPRFRPNSRVFFNFYRHVYSLCLNLPALTHSDFEVDLACITSVSGILGYKWVEIPLRWNLELRTPGWGERFNLSIHHNGNRWGDFFLHSEGFIYNFERYETHHWMTTLLSTSVQPPRPHSATARGRGSPTAAPSVGTRSRKLRRGGCWTRTSSRPSPTPSWAGGRAAGTGSSKRSRWRDRREGQTSPADM
jgi:hypothetical protein